MNKPYINVGIVTAKEISFTLNGVYRSTNGETLTGRCHASFSAGGRISLNGKEWNELELIPDGNGCSFTLHDVTIGISYHWERHEEQTFTGRLRLITDSENVIAINSLPVEDYLVSVISSEMSATSSLEFLKSCRNIPKLASSTDMQKEQ